MMMENGIPIKGMYRDVMRGPGGIVVFDSGWDSNTIVRNCRVLIAGFMKSDEMVGIRRLVVGQGKDEWDAQWNSSSPPGPAPETANQLESAYDPPITLSHVAGRGYIEIDYLDELDKPVVSGVTSRLQVKAILEPGYPAPVEFNIYPLREFGLFGMFGGEPYMINCVRHPVIYKDLTATLEREIKLYF
jgi:hypothetical protein